MAEGEVSTCTILLHVKPLAVYSHSFMTPANLADTLQTPREALHCCSAGHRLGVKWVNITKKCSDGGKE